jgi:hypothetical protein
MGILRPHKVFKTAIFLLLVAVLCLGSAARAQDEVSSGQIQLYEQKIKAGLLYNFLKYTNWPLTTISRSGGSLRVCLLGNDPMDNYLYPLQGRTAQQYTITITRIDNVSGIDGCNLLFIHRSEEDSLSNILQLVKGRHILTISDIDEFAAQGGMVEFGMEDQRINLLINRRAVTAAGLNIQDRLVKLAKLVTERNG